MSAEYILMSNKTAIVSTLCADQRFILNKVHEKQLITTREYNNLKSINKENVEGHVVELLDMILNKGEEDCKHFLNILQTDEDIKATFPKLKQLQLKGISLPKPVQESSPNDEYMLHDNKRQKREEVYQLNTRLVGLSQGMITAIAAKENKQQQRKKNGNGKKESNSTAIKVAAKKKNSSENKKVAAKKVSLGKTLNPTLPLVEGWCTAAEPSSV